MSEYLFVYGTLQPECAPTQIADVVEQLRPVGKGSVAGMLYDLGGYPGAVPDPLSKWRITGTVMLLPVDKNVLRRLDAYEGYDPASPEASEYVRELQRVELTTGGTLECWFYSYNWKPDPAQAIPGGAWRK